jgi:hypothetical protein
MNIFNFYIAAVMIGGFDNLPELSPYQYKKQRLPRKLKKQLKKTKNAI